MPKNLSAQFVCPSPKVLDFNEKRLHWVSVVRGLNEKYVKNIKKFVMLESRNHILHCGINDMATLV